MANSRYKTGQTCEATGMYAFDGYADGTSLPAPTSDERRIPLKRGDRFPPVKSANKAAWWKQI